MDHQESASNLVLIAYRLATDHKFADELREQLPEGKVKAVQHLSPDELSALKIFVSKRYSLESLCTAFETSPTDGRWWTR
jgi:hypothetical protein